MQVAADRASVMRCRRSLAPAVGRCCCCHRCCQSGAGPPVASRPEPCRGWPAFGPGRLRPGPLVSGRNVRRDSRVKRDFACTLAEAIPPVLVVLRAQSRLGLEGRTRTLSGPSPDLTSSVSGLLRDSAHLRQVRSRRLPCCSGVAVTTLDRPPEWARGGHGHGSGGGSVRSGSTVKHDSYLR